MIGLDSPAEWRVLTCLYTSLQPSVVATICDDQQVQLDHLVRLEAFDYLRASVDGVEVALEDLSGSRGLKAATVAITGAGRLKVKKDPFVQAVAALVTTASKGSVRYLRRAAQVEDEHLRSMEDAGIISAYGSDGGRHIPFNTFRRIPDHLYVRLTKKGRRYYSFPSRAGFPGRKPHDVAGAASSD